MDNKRLVAIVLVGIMTASCLTGCGSVTGKDVVSMKLDPALTQQEVLDYYAESMAYDTVVSRNLDTADKNNQYATFGVSNESKVNDLKKALAETEKMLSSNTYSGGADSNKYLSKTMFEYTRALLNDKSLNNGNITKIEQALGYYFVDVAYTISPAYTGGFKGSCSLLGMAGGFNRSSLTGEDSINNDFLRQAVLTLNRYFAREGINKIASYNVDAQTFSITEQATQVEPIVAPVVVEPIIPEGEQAVTEGEQAVAEGEPVATEGEQPVEGETIPVEAVVKPATEVTPEASTVETKAAKYGERAARIDLKLFNAVAGYGTNSAYIPDLSMIYSMPITNTISGVGLYPCGGLGLSLFGFDRTKMSGTMNLRYVYKEDLINPNEISLQNIYVTYYNIDTGFSANNDSIVPTFLEKDFATLIERADRAMVNCDITGLIAGDIFSDMGMAVLRGYEEENGNLLRQISTIRRIISRDIANNAYLVELETYRQESVESDDSYASYKDQVYVVIEQRGSEFVISDWIIMSRQLVNQPDISPYKSTAKRIVGLGLTGEVTEENQKSANILLDELYKASSYRVLNGPKTIGDVEVAKGMYDCFDANTEMLDSTRKEKINSDLRGYLVKYGTSTTAKMDGIVTEWIGGSTNQVEFTTEELITYQGRNVATYLTCYYLMSCMEDVWVIDDIQVLSEEELTGESVTAILGRLEN